MHYFSASCHDEEVPFEPTAETERQTIRSLLPDEDDLFSDVFNELKFCSDLKGDGANTEDFGLFNMELEENNASLVGNRDFDLTGGVSHFFRKSKDLISTTNKLASSWTGGSNQCLMGNHHGSEKDGAGLSKKTDDILLSQSIIDSASKIATTDGNSCTLNSVPSSLNISSVGDHFGLPIPSHSLDVMKFGGKYISSFEPHSFPDCDNNLNNIIQHEFGSNMANMAGSLASDRNNIRNMGVAGPNWQSMEFQERISTPFSNDTCPIHGHPWNNCYLFHQNSLNHKVWPSSPLFSNITNSPSPPQISGFPAYYPGFLGNMAPLRNFPMLPMTRGSPIISHSGRNLKKASNDFMNSSPQTAQSFGPPHEMWRNVSRRRNQGNYNNSNKKEFELDIERILRGDDGRTTLMLKNIPNKYSSKLLVAAIDEHCRGIYDFVYLPIDFKNNCNVGYAFINLIDPIQIVSFYKSFSGRKWEKFNSEKVAAVAYARIQGKAALIAHFQNSSLMNEDKRCRPVLFCTDGPNAGEPEPFPLGTNIRVKGGKARGIFHEEIHGYHESPSTSPNSSESDRESL